MRVLCQCGRFMRVVQNGVTVEELTCVRTPSRLWDADRWECPECGFTIITGFAKAPIAEHWQFDYDVIVARYAPVFRGRWVDAE